MQTSSCFAPGIVVVTRYHLVLIPRNTLTNDIGHQGMNLVQHVCPGSSTWVMKVTFDSAVNWITFSSEKSTEPANGASPIAPDVQFLLDQDLRLFRAGTQ